MMTKISAIVMMFLKDCERVTFGLICEKREQRMEWFPWKYLFLVFPLLYQLSLSLAMMTVNLFPFFSIDSFVFCNNYWFYSCNKRLNHCHKKPEFGILRLCFYKLHALHAYIGFSCLYHNKEKLQNGRLIHGKLAVSTYIYGPGTENSYVLCTNRCSFLKASFIQATMVSTYKRA